MRLHALEGLLADDVLNAAGVGHRHRLGYSQRHQPLGEQLMPFIHPLRHRPALVGEFNPPLLGIHGDISVFPQQPYRPADTGFGKIQFLSNIDGTDISLLLFEHQYRFQIIFPGLLHLHTKRLLIPSMDILTVSLYPRPQTASIPAHLPSDATFTAIIRTALLYHTPATGTTRPLPPVPIHRL